MSRLFQRRRDPQRNELEELRRVLNRLKNANVQTRSAVGAGVQLANADFVRRFAGVESFRRLPAEQQERFWLELSELEFGLRSQEPGMAIGVGLYRIWLRETLAERHGLAELLGEQLAELSRAGYGGHARV